MSNSVEFKYSLGDEVQDLVTGFKGVITGQVRWISGCNQYTVNPGLDKEGKVAASEWLDENRVKLLKTKKVDLEKKVARDRGGPANVPAQRRG